LLDHTKSLFEDIFPEPEVLFCSFSGVRRFGFVDLLLVLYEFRLKMGLSIVVEGIPD
jgi:hypothetical protein